MRIGIGVRILEYNRSGFERYLRGLLENLAGIDDRNEYVLYSDHPIDEKRLTLSPNFSIKVVERGIHSQVWTNYTLPLQVKKDNIDIFHFPDSSVWFRKAKRTVVTLHDISPVLFPELEMVSKEMFYYFRFLCWLIKRKANIIITVSEKSKSDIVNYLKVKKEKVRVIYPGVHPRFRIVDSRAREEVREKFRLEKDFILFTGSFQKRKNLGGLIKAYEYFAKESKGSYGLVITGESRRSIGSHYLSADELIRNSPVRDKIRFLGYVDDHDLVSLYNAASLFVFISFYEAFGFPLLEAMACGTPVITSNNSSGPEIVGDAAILVNPHNPVEIAQAMCRCLEGEELCTMLIKKGLKRAKDFSWRNAAQQMLKVYQELEVKDVTFSFGENWLKYIKDFDERGFEEAKNSLRRLLGMTTLKGKTFIDIGCGSGIFSLAAIDIGASRVISTDTDPKSVQACRVIKQRRNVPHWLIWEGSILDKQFNNSLGKAGIVYSWGVLHHTGSMWKAIDNAASLVDNEGSFLLAIYNRHYTSPLWGKFKRLYNTSGRFLQKLMVWSILFPRIVARLIKLKHPLREKRGMSIYYDAVDWAGGLPYEYASFDEVVSFVENKGFSLVKGMRTKSIGCNQFVFQKRVV